METYETIKKFLSEGGKCLLIENGKPVGVVLTMEEYEKLKENKKENKKESPELLMSDIDTSVSMSDINTINTNTKNPIGEAIMKEMDFSDLPTEALTKAEMSEEFTDIGLADDITLEDLGLDELPG